MNRPDDIRRVLRDKQLASLGDAYVNFIYSLALTRLSGEPQGVKVSDRILAEAFKLAGLREFLGSRIARKDLANASESLLVEAYRRDLLTIEESVTILAGNPEDPVLGLVNLLKTAAGRLVRT
jgi:hypothetical protein